MITREKETYLTATEAAKHLGIARGTFYKQYRDHLQEYIVGNLKRIHYRLSQVEQLSSVKPVEKMCSGMEQGEPQNTPCSAKSLADVATAILNL